MKRPIAVALLATVLALPVPAQSPSADARRGLRIGVLPDADSLPILVADAEGRFAAEGVDVALVRFNTARDRDAAFQAGQVDGVVSDLLAAFLAAQGGFDAKVTSLTDGRYGIVTAPGSGLLRPSQLAGVEIGISSNTIIQYAVDALLSGAGLQSSAIKGIAVPNIAVRMELLAAGKLKAACLPEPLLTAAIGKGATLVAASDDAGLRAGVILFSAKVLDESPAAVSAFYRAYWKAAQAINADGAAYRAFLVEKALFPAETRDAYRFVRYERPRLPSEGDLLSVAAWMRGKGLLTREIAGASILDGRPIAAAAEAGAAPAW
jgi:NitT/TauT family transport system substrate-binding protein